MNYFIDGQIVNMISIAKTFEASCQMAATKDDGRTSRQEEATLRAIHESTQRFIKELKQIQNQ